MKIFAKRKRKAVPEGSAASNKEARDEFASDPIVEALLKKDEKEWNSKERRMIKRYQKRKAEIDQTDTGNTALDLKTESTDVKLVDEKKEGTEKADSLQEESVKNSVTTNEVKSQEVAKITRAENDDIAAEAKVDLEPLDKEEVKNDSTEIKAKTKVTEVQSDGALDPDHEVYKLLEQLNSKTKRTLTRKLDRQGPSVADEVVAEAKKIIADLAETAAAAKKKDAQAALQKDAASNEKSGGGKKSKKQEPDWSNLSAEERLRREEQRRKQKEAAERRARGEDKTAGYKHPLNSERRRANKRKPKWKSGTGGSKFSKNDHNSSGYMHRVQK